MPRLLCALCVALCAFPALAQDKEPTAKDSAAKQPAADLQATILKLEKEVVDLFQKRKTDLLKNLLSDDFVEVTSEGRRDKAAVFKELDAGRDEPLDESAVELTDVKLTLVTPETALLTYRLEIKDAPRQAFPEPDPNKAPVKPSGPIKPDKSEEKAPFKKASPEKKTQPEKTGKERAGEAPKKEPAAEEDSGAMAQHISSLWVKRNGRWVNVFYQSTPDASDEE